MALLIDRLTLYINQKEYTSALGWIFTQLQFLKCIFFTQQYFMIIRSSSTDISIAVRVFLLAVNSYEKIVVVCSYDGALNLNDLLFSTDTIPNFNH